MKTQLNYLLVGWLATLVCGSAGSLGAATWTQKADMPTARMLVCTSVVDGKIYAISALKGSGNLTKVEAYDPATETWTKKADMPTARAFLSTSVVDGKIYAIGGSTSWGGTQLATVEAYDPATDTWTKKADMPTARDAETGVVDGKIYAIGGYRGGVEIATVEVYDPATDTWVKKADMPTARELHTISVVNGKIYAIGGQSQSTFAGFSTVEVYDPVQDHWTRRKDMPTPRICPACVLDDTIYAFGGRSTRGGAPLSTVFKYDTGTDVWTQEDDMPVNNGGMGVSTVGRKIYLIGGSSALYPFNVRLETVWEYIPMPEFDFNEDGVVDARDMSLLVDHWHTDKPRYDLAPAPAGDGLVDVQDLVALSEHLFEDYRIIAHWRLDETEGDVAYDSAAENDARVLGDPVWQPGDGQVDGALQLDGVDDHINALVKLNPAEEVFSVFAWIQGAIPGQVIISQEGGADWLRTDAQGYFMTALMGTSGRTSGPLISETLITDGNWHRVGLTYDGLNRVLSVDDTVVIQDTQPSLAKVTGTLLIGTGGNQAADSFWFGLIDDVQLYNRAIAP